MFIQKGRRMKNKKTILIIIAVLVVLSFFVFSEKKMSYREEDTLYLMSNLPKYKETEFKILDKEIFGIKLGEHIEDVKKRYAIDRGSSFLLNQSYFHYPQREDITYIHIQTYNNQVEEIEVKFNDSFFYDEIKKVIEKEYEVIDYFRLQKKEASHEQSIHYTVKLDGEEVSISVSSHMYVKYEYPKITKAKDNMKARILADRKTSKVSEYADEL